MEKYYQIFTYNVMSFKKPITILRIHIDKIKHKRKQENDEQRIEDGFILVKGITGKYHIVRCRLYFRMSARVLGSPNGPS